MKLVEGSDYRKVKGYKYQTLLSQQVETGIEPERSIVGEHGWVVLDANGSLVARIGYCWDGPSGPTFDTATTLRASLFHDCLYQLFREEKLSAEKYREAADRLLRWVMLEDGAWRWRARLWLWAVRRFAKGAARG